MTLVTYESDCDFRCSALAPLVHPGGGPFAALLVVTGLSLRGAQVSSLKVAEFCCKYFLCKYSEIRYGESDIIRRTAWKGDMTKTEVKDNTKTLVLCCFSLILSFGYVYMMHRNFPSCKAKCLTN